MPWKPGLTSHGHEIPLDIAGELNAYGGSPRDGAAMREAIGADGYLFVRDALDPAAVLAAREAVFAHLHGVGEVEMPLMDGIATGVSRRAETEPDLAAFWRRVCETPALRRLTHSGPMLDLMEALLGEPVRPFDFLWMRAMAPGRASAFHFDHVYMNRGSERLHTVWTPLGHVPMEEGALLVVENSHRLEEVIAPFRGFDVEADTSRPGHVTMDPVAFAREHGCRLLSADFRPGDVLVFPMFTLHGSLDNLSPINRIRLSCDTRYQPAADPADERWVGANPVGHGKGYGGVGGAQPLTAAPLHR